MLILVIFHSIQEGNVESGDGKHMDQLIVLDEVYSDDSDAEQGSKEVDFENSYFYSRFHHCNIYPRLVIIFLPGN